MAPNPSPMTYLGTNTFIIGKDQLCVIDPGPDNDAHLDALLTAIGNTPVSHIIVTHNHLDHSPLAKRLSEATGAQVYAFGNHLAGRSAIMSELAAKGFAGGGEGIDHDFAPDVTLQDGEVIATPDWTLKVIHTPGHIGNHISLIWGDAVFTGDHVMGWASSLVSPPDGDLTDFMASCAKLQTIPARVYYAGHGGPIHAPKARLDWLIAHRLGRETQILEALQSGPMTPFEITKVIYTDVPKTLMLAAERNVFAHLIDLHQRGKISATPNLSPVGKYRFSQEN
ncbi:MAG: MBL fold metallo-hydrolase [Pseudomonadales bacterium]